MVDAQRLILECLEQYGKPLNVSQLAKEIQRTREHTHRTVVEMHKRGKLRRFKGRAVGYSYGLKSHYPAPPPLEISTNNFSLQNVENLLIKWAESGWEPKIFQSAKWLPYTVGKLYEIASDTAFYGSPVDQKILDQLRANLIEFSKDLTNALAMVQGMIELDSLWQAEELASCLIKDDSLNYPELTKNLKKNH